MANPTVWPIKENTVYKVATNVTTGNINKHRYEGRDKEYLATYRTTGESAPSATDVKWEGKRLFIDHPEQETISNSVAIDIYVLCNKEDGKSGYGTIVVWV